MSCWQNWTSLIYENTVWTWRTPTLSYPTKSRGANPYIVRNITYSFYYFADFDILSCIKILWWKRASISNVWGSLKWMDFMQTAYV